MASSIGYTSSALNYFAPIARYTDLTDGYFVRHQPVNTITGASTINFTIPPSEDFIDLPECYIDLKLKIVTATGGNLPADAAVAFADNVAFSVFKSVIVRLNSVQITPTTIHQTYSNYFATRYGVGKTGTKIHLLHLQGLTTEAAGKNDTKADAATGWTLRKKWTSESKELHLIAQVPSEFFRSCSQLLPPLQDLRLEFKLNEKDFALVGTGAHNYKLTNFELVTRQVKVTADATMALYKQQALTPLMLNFTSLAVQSFTIPAGKHVELIRGIFPQEMPHQIFMVLVETDRLNGVQSKDPFLFTNASVEKVILRQNGTAQMTESIVSDFTENGDAKDAYYFMCQAFDVGHNGHDVNVTYEQFLNGLTIWAWTLSPDMDANSGVGLLQRPANFEVDIYVKNTQNNAGLTALFFGKVGKSVELGRDNSVVLK